MLQCVSPVLTQFFENTGLNQKNSVTSETRVESLSADLPHRVLWQYQQEEVSTVGIIGPIKKPHFNVQSYSIN